VPLIAERKSVSQPHAPHTFIPEALQSHVGIALLCLTLPQERIRIEHVLPRSAFMVCRHYDCPSFAETIIAS
jgi:hypothetical protein